MLRHRVRANQFAMRLRFCRWRLRGEIFIVRGMGRKQEENQKSAKTEEKRAQPGLLFVLCVFALAAAGFIRFYDLGQSEVRGDELNFLNWSLRNPPIVDLWKNPPWLDQIPLSESVAVLWARVRPGEPTEASVREPFAFLGWITIAGCMLWMARRWGWSAAFLFGCWMAFLPFHVFQSREAYYYVVAMALAAGLACVTIDRASRAWEGGALRPADFAVWLAWALFACLAHMSAWVFAVVCWLTLLIPGVRAFDRAARKRHLAWMLGTGVLLALLMSRWILRAAQKVMEAKSAAGVLTETGFIGGALGWVAPRVLPMFVGGYNALGFLILAFVLASAVSVFRLWRNQDRHYRVASGLALAALASSYAYVTLIGRGSAKISYFSAALPIFLVWAAATVDRAWLRGVVLARAWFGLALMAVLVFPAWQVTRLTGKPVPYRALQARLDELLPPGSVAIIDRWFEPWNEMVRYAPTNVAVTFTVPDEPFENYTRLQWRDVTRARIEAGGVDAFIRLARNHEERVGLWTWPETWFARHAAVSNRAAFWLRDRGYAPEEDYHRLNDNRLRVDIFYNTRDDAVQRAVEGGRRFPVFFGPDMPFEKSGPMGFCRFRTQQFMDWRILGEAGVLEIVNTFAEPRQVIVEVSAISPAGNKLVSAPPAYRFNFPPNQFRQWPFGPVTLKPGSNKIRLTDAQHPAGPPLFIADVQVREKTVAP